MSQFPVAHSWHKEPVWDPEQQHPNRIPFTRVEEHEEGLQEVEPKLGAVQVDVDESCVPAGAQ